MNVAESIMLSEINHSEKDKYHMISFICGILKKKTNEQREHRERERERERERR